MVTNILPDGREIRALKGTYTQQMMFGLKRKLPSHEGILSLRDMSQVISVGAEKSLSSNGGGWWRTSEYGVYRRGFELEPGTPLGTEIVWVEDGYRFTFEVPDVRDPLERNRGLRESSGMLVLPLGKLRFNRNKRLVTVAPDFDPEKDVSVKDVIRPGRWAIPDAGGYPLRSNPSTVLIPEARALRSVPSAGFEDGATGWHGSISLLLAERFEHARRVVDAHGSWRYPAGVAVAIGPFE